MKMNLDLILTEQFCILRCEPGLRASGDKRFSTDVVSEIVESDRDYSKIGGHAKR